MEGSAQMPVEFWGVFSDNVQHHVTIKNTLGERWYILTNIYVGVFL